MPITQQSKLRIFLSHRGSHKGLVREIKNGLEKTQSVDVFIDEDDLPATGSLPEHLRFEIDNSEYFLAVVSSDMLSSHWVKYELEEARRRERDLGRAFIIVIRLAEVKPTDLPSFLESLPQLELADQKSQHVNGLLETLEKLLLRTVGIDLRRLERGSPPPAGDFLGSKETTTRALVDIYFPSLLAFYESCKDVSSGTFFNVQITSDEWFAPNLQIHLAVQESMAQCIRWKHPKPRLGKDNNGHVPFRRVAFIDKRKSELFDDLRSARASARHLCALMHIHNLMACPLAIVTVDDFVHGIVKEDSEFFASQEAKRFLGISTGVADLVSKVDSKSDSWFNDMTEAVKDMMREQGRDARGMVEASMDFAVFRTTSRSKTTNESVWAGKVASDGALVYYPIPNDAHQFSPSLDDQKLDGVQTNLDCHNYELYDASRRFANLIERCVFRNGETKRASMKKPEWEYIKEWFAVNPLVATLGVGFPDINQLLTVRHEFCPWMLLRDFSLTVAGNYESSIKSIRRRR